MQTGLDAVAPQVIVGERRTDAVFGEPVRMDAQLEQLGQNRRGFQTVTLQLDDHDVAHSARLVSSYVVETQVGVDGQPFSLALIHEGDAVETVLKLFCQRLRGIAQVGAQKIIVGHELLILSLEADRMIGILGVETFHRHPFLLGPPVIVLGLYLQKVKTSIDIGTDTQLLAHKMSCLVYIIHITVGGVEIESVVRGDAQSTRLLHEIVFARQLEQLSEHRHRRDELRVDAIHQPDFFHVLQRDGLKMVQNLLHITTL